ncbi:mechanosensitive ion channel family protein [Shewanella zhangzhouensis]|nr:mechanosensitive ion channel family protein [Shewanella zhangzhouensis]QYK05912.1 mechanosensitive ion channel family protein [Shewanella zhangzhouensis]
MTNQILLACFYLLAFYIIQRNLKRVINALAEKKQVSAARTSLVSRFLTAVLFFITLSLMAVSVGLGYHDVALFVSSAFAVLGVALVAQWSILSNLTAGVLIFFVFPYRIGDRIKVVDKDEDIRGVIQEIALFHVLIQRDDGNLITYPNSQILQKSVIKLLNPEVYDNKTLDAKAIESKTIEARTQETQSLETKATETRSVAINAEDAQEESTKKTVEQKPQPKAP